MPETYIHTTLYGTKCNWEDILKKCPIKRTTLPSIPQNNSTVVSNSEVYIASSRNKLVEINWENKKYI